MNDVLNRAFFEEQDFTQEELCVLNKLFQIGEMLFIDMDGDFQNANNFATLNTVYHLEEKLGIESILHS